MAGGDGSEPSEPAVQQAVQDMFRWENRVFRKSTGKVSDYWEFVKGEGKKIFFATHRRPFRRDDEYDQGLMDQIWKGLSKAKRDEWKRYAETMNAPDQVRRRRVEALSKMRATHQQAGAEALGRRLQKIHMQDMETGERLRSMQASTEGDIKEFTGNQLFYYGTTAEIHRKKLRETALSVLTCGLVDKKEPSAVASALRNQYFMLIKVNIYDSVYVTDSYKARTHPSEISLVIFNLSQGIVRTKNIPVRFNARLLYDAEGVPEEHYAEILQQERKTGIRHSEVRSPQDYEAFNAFSPIVQNLNEFTPKVVVQAREWNLVMGSLFFVAHAARKAAEFKALLDSVSVLEEELEARQIFWEKRKGRASDFRRISIVELEQRLAEARLLTDSRSCYYCHFHLRQHERLKINCSLARTAAVVHNVFGVWRESRYADWDGAPGQQKYDFCSPMPDGFAVAAPEESVSRVVERVVEDEVRELADVMEIVESDAEEEDELPAIVRDRHVDTVRGRVNTAAGRAPQNNRAPRYEDERGRQAEFREDVPQRRFPHDPRHESAPPGLPPSRPSVSSRFGAPRVDPHMPLNVNVDHRTRFGTQDYYQDSRLPSRAPPRMGATRNPNGSPPRLSPLQQYSHRDHSTFYTAKQPAITLKFYTLSAKEVDEDQFTKLSDMHKKVDPPSEKKRRLFRYTTEYAVWERRGY